MRMWIFIHKHILSHDYQASSYLVLPQGRRGMIASTRFESHSPVPFACGYFHINHTCIEFFHMS